MRYLLHHLLDRAAERWPDRPAVVDADGETTYRQLAARAARVASQLRGRGVRPGDRVGIHADKSAATIAAVYGTLRAGAAYVPLDPGSPRERLAKIAASASLALVVADAPRADAAATLAPRVLRLDAPQDSSERDPKEPGEAPDEAPDEEPGEEPGEAPEGLDSDLAYLLYTSGTTGTPKGVMMTHRNALAFVAWAAEEFALVPGDRVSSHAPLHFDLSIFDLFATAWAGAAVVLVPGRLSLFPVRLAEFIHDTAITVWYSVPTVLAGLARGTPLERGRLRGLRVVLFAGEVFPVPALHGLMTALPDTRFANLYGPTETNVCTWHEVRTPPAPDAPPVPIGRAIANVRVWAEKDDGTTARPGEAGELCVTGATVMRGYWNEPGAGLTTRHDEHGQPYHVYRTGDLVHREKDGAFRFIGRRDHQIKRRGYRIEPGEIESALNAASGVVESAVVPLRDATAPDTTRIAAFVVAHEDAVAEAISRACREALPAYMIPDELRLVTRLPRTPTGKVDRLALAQGAWSDRSDRSDREESP